MSLEVSSITSCRCQLHQRHDPKGTHSAFTVCLSSHFFVCLNIIPSSLLLLRYLPLKREIAIEAIVSTIHDSNVLVQRGMLDLLISRFPLHDSFLTTQETIHLIQFVLPVILRRETSVNRRVYAWILSKGSTGGPSEDSSNGKGDDAVLRGRALDFLVEAMILQMSHLSLSKDHASQPFNLSRTLMERPEIRKSQFLERINVSLINYAHYYNEMGDTKQHLIAVRSSYLACFFRAIQSSFVWNCM